MVASSFRPRKPRYTSQVIQQKHKTGSGVTVVHAEVLDGHNVTFTVQGDDVAIAEQERLLAEALAGMGSFGPTTYIPPDVHQINTNGQKAITSGPDGDSDIVDAEIIEDNLRPDDMFGLHNAMNISDSNSKNRRFKGIYHLFAKVTLNKIKLPESKKGQIIMAVGAVASGCVLVYAIYLINPDDNANKSSQEVIESLQQATIEPATVAILSDPIELVWPITWQDTIKPPAPEDPNNNTASQPTTIELNGIASVTVKARPGITCETDQAINPNIESGTIIVKIDRSLVLCNYDLDIQIDGKQQKPEVSNANYNGSNVIIDGQNTTIKPITDSLQDINNLLTQYNVTEHDAISAKLTEEFKASLPVIQWNALKQSMLALDEAKGSREQAIDEFIKRTLTLTLQTQGLDDTLNLRVNFVGEYPEDFLQNFNNAVPANDLPATITLGEEPYGDNTVKFETIE
jgi:hypothetical protein